MIFDAIENAERYTGLGNKFKKAFNFLTTADFDSLQEGKTEIDGDEVFALVQKYNTKDLSQGKWENHQKYIDIQYIISGTENMGVVLADYLDIIEDYNEENDCEILDGDGDFLQVSEGEFVIFYPEDAHMPGLVVEKKEEVHKVVIKIKY